MGRYTAGSVGRFNDSFLPFTCHLITRLLNDFLLKENTVRRRQICGTIQAYSKTGTRTFYLLETEQVVSSIGDIHLSRMKSVIRVPASPDKSTRPRLLLLTATDRRGCPRGAHRKTKGSGKNNGQLTLRETVCPNYPHLNPDKRAFTFIRGTASQL